MSHKGESLVAAKPFRLHLLTERGIRVNAMHKAILETFPESNHRLVQRYGFYEDVITESEKYSWMGPKRYGYAGTKVFLCHREEPLSECLHSGSFLDE